MKEFTTFETLLKPLTKNLMREATERYNGDYYCKSFKTKDHLIVMMYSQLHDLKSLRDVEIGFNGQKALKTPLRKVRRSTLSEANNRRPAGCFLWIADQLMALMPRKKRKEVKRIVKKLDSSPIQLKGKGYNEWTLSHKTLRCQGLKLHIEYEGEIEMPTRLRISRANIDDCSMGKRWPILRNTIYVFDKGYYDFNWWWHINEQSSFFVTRLKSNVAIKEVRNLEVAGEAILEDSLFEFKRKRPRGGKRNEYVNPLRRIVVRREGKEKPLVLVTNLLEVSAETVSELYKERWGIELFFKWIKQNLRIKKFLGRSENAVKLQIAAALIVYLLIGLFKFVVKNKLSLHQLLIWIRHNFYIKKKIYRVIKPPEYDLPANNFKYLTDAIMRSGQL